MIHQTRGTGAGQWEIGLVVSGGGTTSLTLSKPLVYTYTDSGASQAQVVKINEYTNVTVQSGTWTVPAWNGDMGGILTFASKGVFTKIGEIRLDGVGYRYGDARDAAVGYGGEGYTRTYNWSSSGNSTDSAGSCSESASGSGGGSGNGNGGVRKVNDAPGGDGSVGNNGNGQLLLFGGGGSGGTSGDNAKQPGGSGGGIIGIFCKSMSGSGLMTVNGNNGVSSTSNYNRDGGGGAAGHIIICSQTPDIGVDTIRAVNGLGGYNGSYGGNAGGNGAKGLITVYYGATLTGSVSSTYYGSYVNEQDTSLVEQTGGYFLNHFI
jgi:hypothetical protein